MSIFDHLRTAGIAGVKSIAKIKKGNQQLQGIRRGLNKCNIITDLQWLTMEEIIQENHFEKEVIDPYMNKGYNSMTKA